MALPPNGPQLGQRVQTYGYTPELTEMAKAAGNERGIARPPVPDARAITSMDEAYAWLSVIANRTYRRIVAVRSLTEHHTGEPVFSWQRIGAKVGASHTACRQWHAKGIGLIVRHLVFIGCAA